MNFKKLLASAATVSMVASTLVTFTASADAGETIKDVMDRQEVDVDSHHIVTLLDESAIGDGEATIASTDWGMSATAVTVSGGSFEFDTTNPATADSYMFSITQGDFTEYWAVPVVLDDTITVNATVDPSITFDVGTTTASCAGDFVSSDWSVDFGHLNGSRKIASSDVVGVEHICTVLSTNATAGAVVTAKNANGALGLVSASVPADYIPSTTDGAAADGAIQETQPNYGMCYTATKGYNDSSVPAGHDVVVTGSAFSYDDDVCDTTLGGEVGTFDGTAQTVWSVAGVTDSAYATLFLKVGISATQPAHNDYADSITFVATATF